MKNVLTASLLMGFSFNLMGCCQALQAIKEEVQKEVRAFEELTGAPPTKEEKKDITKKECEEEIEKNQRFLAGVVLGPGLAPNSSCESLAETFESQGPEAALAAAAEDDECDCAEELLELCRDAGADIPREAEEQYRKNCTCENSEF